jgi:hypothetical protein
MDVELALKINKIVHDECKDAPHDIGLRIIELIENHQAKKLILSGVVITCCDILSHNDDIIVIGCCGNCDSDQDGV